MQWASRTFQLDFKVELIRSGSHPSYRHLTTGGRADDANIRNSSVRSEDSASAANRQAGSSLRITVTFSDEASLGQRGPKRTTWAKRSITSRTWVLVQAIN